MSRADAENSALVSEYVDHLERLPLRQRERSRPMFGGVFGCGEFSLVSVSMVVRGIDWVAYTVRHTETGSIVGGAHETKAAAIAIARKELLRDPLGYRMRHMRIRIEQMRRAAIAKKEAERVIREAQELRPPLKPSKASIRSISRRRKMIFQKSGGRCHYCQCELELEGRWHVEHMMPKSLGGTDNPGNLVAACAPCNLKKRDRTAEEFISGKKAKEGV